MSSTRPTRAPHVLRRAAQALAIIVLWVSLLQFPISSASSDLDQSWKQCLGYFARTHRQAGVDHVWVYGPLGYLFGRTPYDPDLFWRKYVWEAVTKLSVAALVVGRCPRLALVMLVWFSWHYDHAQELALLVLLLSGLELLRKPSPGRLLALQAIPVAILMALTKFSILCYSAVVWLAVTGCWILDGRRREAALFLTACPSVLAVAWCAAGQRLENLPAYIRNSAQLAGNYPDAMAIWGSWTEVLLAILIGGVLVVHAGLSSRALRSRPVQAGLALVGASFWMEWKLGFVRHDGHSSHFFNYCLAIPFVISLALAGVEDGAAPADPPWRGRARAVLAVACLLLALTGRSLVFQVPFTAAVWPANNLERIGSNLDALVHPAALEARLQADRVKRRDAWRLTEAQHIIGQATVDMLPSYEQGIVLLNGFDYHPRPIFQSNCVYNPALGELNAAFVRSESGPAFVLFRLQPMDGHLPLLEDAAALRELFGSYAPVGADRGYLILARRRGPAPATPPRPIWTTTAGFDEEITLPRADTKKAARLLSVEIEYSLFGQLVRTLFKPPIPWISVRTDAGDAGTYRLVVPMARTATLIDPFLRQTEDLLDAVSGKGMHPRSVLITTTARARWCFQPRFRLTLLEDPALFPAPSRP